MYDFDRRQSPRTIAASWVYVRLHAPGGQVRGQLQRRRVERLGARYRCAWRSEGKDTYCYLDNDQAGYAVKDALRLKDLVTSR
jgi:uncharacterized protein YecE (DUF72 family)